MSKTIFELNEFAGDLDGTEVLPIDTGLETFKLTLSQIAAFVSGVKIEDDEEWESETTEVTYADIPAARDRIWMFCRAATESTAETQLPAAKIDFPSDTSVRVSFGLPPGAGSYILKGK